MKGDRVEVVVDVGDGTKTYEVEATRAGRRVDVRTGRGLVEVVEVTRGGTPVRTARVMQQRGVGGGSEEVAAVHRGAGPVGRDAHASARTAFAAATPPRPETPPPRVEPD